MKRELTHLQSKLSYLQAKEMESLHKMSKLGYFMIALKRKKQGQDKENNTWFQNKILDCNSAEVCWPQKAQKPNSNSSCMTMNDWVPAPVFQLKSGCNINQQNKTLKSVSYSLQVKNVKKPKWQQLPFVNFKQIIKRKKGSCTQTGDLKG